MALPLIAAGMAARAVVSKLATRAVGGITGAGAKSVGSVYKEQGTGSVKIINIKKEAKDLSKEVRANISKKKYQDIVNDGYTMAKKMEKSGQSAKELAAVKMFQNKSIPKKPTIKIKSGK
jgi:hypothetical protein